MASQGNRGSSSGQQHGSNPGQQHGSSSGQQHGSSSGQQHGGSSGQQQSSFSGQQHGQERGGQDQSRSQQGGTGVMDTVRENAANWASNAGDQAQQAWEKARHGVQEFGSHLPQNANEALDSVSGMISRYPIPSLLCAVAVGFILARTISD